MTKFIGMSETLWWAYYPPLFTVCYVLRFSLVAYTKAWRSENLTHTKKWGCPNDFQIRIVADIPLILSCPGFINPRALKASQVVILLMWLWNVNFYSIWCNFKIIFPKKIIFLLFFLCFLHFWITPFNFYFMFWSRIILFGVFWFNKIKFWISV